LTGSHRALGRLPCRELTTLHDMPAVLAFKNRYRGRPRTPLWRMSPRSRAHDYGRPSRRGWSQAAAALAALVPQNHWQFTDKLAPTGLIRSVRRFFLLAVLEYSLAFYACYWDLGRMFLDLGLIVSPSESAGARWDFAATSYSPPHYLRLLDRFLWIDRNEYPQKLDY
jgi:hypothetical protein